MLEQIIWWDKEIFEIAMIYFNPVWFSHFCELLGKPVILLLYFISISLLILFKNKNTLIIDKKNVYCFIQKIFLIILLLSFSDYITYLLKNYIQRYRPGIQTGLYFRPGAFCMPSSHAWNLMFLAIIIKYYFPLTKYYFIFLAFIVGLARFFSQYHFLSDVIVGWFGGIFLAYLILAIFKRIYLNNNMFKFLLPLLILISINCNNNPYSSADKFKNIYYDTFEQEPKHLDPALAYSNDEYRIIQQIYEPFLQYHFLKRPYELIPLTVNNLPKINNTGNTSIYTIEIKNNIYYADHAAFAKNSQGKYIYHLDNQSFNKYIQHPQDLPKKGTRLLTAEDYVYQIKRMANPQIACPIYSILASYIDGFEDLSKEIAKEIERIRMKRREQQGSFYNQVVDEQTNPIYLDLRKFNLSGVKIKNNTTLEISLKQKYPQFIYWLAMPFFSPMPWEADRFYNQKASAELNFTIDRFPIGTGPFVLSLNQPHYRLELSKNKNYHEEYFPKENNTLEDAGKRLPLLDKAVYSLEKESIPRWNKFLQGYYDTSGTPSDVFDSIIQVSDNNGVDLTKEMYDKGIKLVSAETSIIYYYAFNMLDDVVGGYSEKNKKLRQAISIALDIEEYIQIFLNDRGIAAQSIIAPGIFGYDPLAFNPVIYDFDFKNNTKKRKNISVAQKLLAEAGYPNGIDKFGKRLTIYYDAYQINSDKSDIYWLKKQFQKIGIDLQIRSTDYNQFRKKIDEGNYQMFRWGWHADYPDPENFLFLLYGPNGGAKGSGKNEANYINSNYDILFKKMETMNNSPQRLAIIKQMIKISQEDAPWIWGFHPVSYSLCHSWYKNTDAMTISYGTLKYKKIDVALRNKYLKKEN